MWPNARLITIGNMEIRPKFIHSDKVLVQLCLRQFNQSGSRGFTLFGVLMIIISLGLTAAVFLAAIPPMQGQGNANLTFARVDALELALKKYKAQNGNTPPATLSILISGNGAPCDIDMNSSHTTYKKLIGWCGPYVDQPVLGASMEYQTDGWGTVFQYNGTSIVSCGPDRKCGTVDDLTFTNF